MHFDFQNNTQKQGAHRAEAQDTQDAQVQDNEHTPIQEIQDSSSEVDSDENQVQLRNQILSPRRNEAHILESEDWLDKPSTTSNGNVLAPAEAASHTLSQLLNTEKKRQAPNKLTAPNSKIKKNRTASQSIVLSNESTINKALKKLDDISSRAQRSLTYQNQDDHLDHFGKYIASLLRNVPTSTSFSLQQKIISLVLQAQNPVPEPPRTPTVEDLMADGFSDLNQRTPPPLDTPGNTDATSDVLSDNYQRRPFTPDAFGIKNITSDGFSDPYQHKETTSLDSPYTDESDYFLTRL